MKKNQKRVPLDFSQNLKIFIFGQFRALSVRKPGRKTQNKIFSRNLDEILKFMQKFGKFYEKFQRKTSDKRTSALSFEKYCWEWPICCCQIQYITCTIVHLCHAPFVHGKNCYTMQKRVFRILSNKATCI